MREKMYGLTGAVAGLAAGTGLMGWAVRGRASSVFAPSVYRGDPSRPVLALTFDDGPSESTPALLDVLSRHGVSATFFMCGINVRRLPDIARMVRERGHEIGNHTDSHARFDFKSPEFMYREMAAAQRAIEDVTGAAPRLFRPPFGVRWFGLREAQRRLRLQGVMWTVIGRDWRLPAARVASRVLSGASNGAILCLHDGRATAPRPDVRATLETVATILPVLLQRGFQFDTVSGMLSSEATHV